MKILFYRITFYIISFFSLFSTSQKIIKKKLILGSIIVGVITLTSCRAHKKNQPTCYKFEIDIPDIEVSDLKNQ